METVSFTDMKSGTREDYLLLDRLEQAHVATLPGRVLEALQRLQGGHPANVAVPPGRAPVASQHALARDDQEGDSLPACRFSYR